MCYFCCRKPIFGTHLGNTYQSSHGPPAQVIDTCTQWSLPKIRKTWPIWRKSSSGYVRINGDGQKLDCSLTLALNQIAYDICYNRLLYLIDTTKANAIVFRPVQQDALSQLRKQIAHLLSKGRISWGIVMLGLFYLDQIRIAASRKRWQCQLAPAVIVGLMLAHKSWFPSTWLPCAALLCS